jgi:hypothetical protein
LSERVSEVNLLDLHDVRAQLTGNDSQIEVRLGGQDLGERLKQGLDALDKYRQTLRGSTITHVDLQTGRIVIGTSSGSKVSTATDAPESAANSPDTNGTGVSAGKPPATTKTDQGSSAADQRQKPPRNNVGREVKPSNTSRIRMR